MDTNLEFKALLFVLLMVAMLMWGGCTPSRAEDFVLSPPLPLPEKTAPPVVLPSNPDPVPEAPAAEPVVTPEVEAESDPLLLSEGWQLVADEQLGFQFLLPPGWTYDEIVVNDPNLPPSGAMERLLHLRPEPWDGDFVPLSLAIYASEAAYRRDHLPGDLMEEVEVNGATMIRETYHYGERHALAYTFQNDTEVYVLLNNYFTGWPERVEGREPLAALIDPLVASIAFIE